MSSAFLAVVADQWQEFNLRYQHQQDTPKPIVQFTIPSLSDSIMVIGISELDVTFWSLSFVTLCVQTLVNVIVGYIIYETILSRRNSTVSYVIGYGILLPCICYLSIIALQTLRFHNIAHMLCISATGPAILTFRCIEAMHGTLPAFAYNIHKEHGQNRLSKFLMYYASSIQLNFVDEDTKQGDIHPISRQEIQMKLRYFIRMFCETTIIYSILIPTHFEPFPSVPRETWKDYFHWGNLANNYCVAYCMSVCLESAVTGLGILFSAFTGYSTLSIHDDPLLLSSSVREFWGRRWNRMVRAAMFRGVYKPIRNAEFPRCVAAMATFCASGLIHEFVLYLFTFREGSDYVPAYGKQTLFFCYNAFIIVLEYGLQGVKLEVGGFKWRYLSRPVRTLLVLMTVLPVSHWFTDEYIRGKFFSDIAMGFPRIFLVSQ